MKFLENDLDILLSNAQEQLYDRYAQLLQTWNEKINLTGIRNEEEILIKHFYDSLACLKVLPEKSSFSFIDVGSGAGFPGLPIKIARPDISLTLVESVNKKADFCRLAVEELGLDNTRILNSRAEDIGHKIEHREKYDWAAARAVADLSVLMEYLLPLVKIDGSAIAMKSSNYEEELSHAKPALKKLGGKLSRVMEYDLPENYGERSLIVIEKISPTPRNYPRRAGIPAKKPLS